MSTPTLTQPTRYTPNDGVNRAELIRRRQSLGLSNSEMARRLGLSRMRYSNYEKGYRRIPFIVLMDICRHLECSAEDLAEKNPPFFA